MRLKTATDACQDALIRGGFKTTSSPRWLRLGGDNPGEVVYDAWFPRDVNLGDYFIEIYKGTVGGSRTNGWDWTSEIRLRLV